MIDVSSGWGARGEPHGVGAEGVETLSQYALRYGARGHVERWGCFWNDGVGAVEGVLVDRSCIGVDSHQVSQQVGARVCGIDCQGDGYTVTAGDRRRARRRQHAVCANRILSDLPIAHLPHSSFTPVRLSSELRSIRSLNGSTPTKWGARSNTRVTVCRPLLTRMRWRHTMESRPYPCLPGSTAKAPMSKGSSSGTSRSWPVPSA